MLNCTKAKSVGKNDKASLSFVGRVDILYEGKRIASPPATMHKVIERPIFQKTPPKKLTPKNPMILEKHGIFRKKIQPYIQVFKMINFS